jgi:hypothetical protein
MGFWEFFLEFRRVLGEFIGKFIEGVQEVDFGEFFR